MEFIKEIIDIVLHLDQHLNVWAASAGGWTYVLLFTIIFCETGLVVAPFLPGDSLLFAVGALAATPGSPINLVFVMVLLFVAAILGDFVNYHIGKFLGPKVFKSEGGVFFNKKHLMSAQAFYDKHGGKTIILARFIPVLRTFAPFVAGIGAMSYPRFLSYNIIGAFIWVVLFTIGGYLFGNVPVVQRNFHIVIFAIIIISCIPGVIAYINAKLEAKK
ncbi:membrane-associated protein [Parelusimicrobium proximum]|uniref:DedA family protein n=1 Tax=Parelusimicrobium proximum TaxID=3228953 RepID=UPI003D17FA0C